MGRYEEGDTDRSSSSSSSSNDSKHGNDSKDVATIAAEQQHRQQLSTGASIMLTLQVMSRSPIMMNVIKFFLFRRSFC